MIKNVIFDYGNTIVEYFPEEIVKSFGITNKEDIDTLKVLFDRKYWDLLDKGEITIEEYKNDVLEKIPERLKKASEDMILRWYHNLPLIDGVEDLIKKLKDDGFKLYILSNISQDFIDDKDRFEIFKYFDGCVFSAEMKMVKPDRKIYEHLLKTFNLKAEECVFLDDKEENIESAKKCGIDGFVFKSNPKEAEEYIYKKNEL